MASGLLSLKWNHHRSTFLHVLANIRQKESYCDVTLACAGKFYSAHKLVLSTCSEYFEEMFERTQCKHPVIVLKDIGADELEALLSYMYDGEVNVLQEHLSSLIKAAECLKIKGLAVADSDPSEHSSNSTKDKNSSSSSNSKDVHRSHNSTNSSNHNSFPSDSSSRQFRNSSGGVKRPNLGSKQDDGPSKRRRPESSASLSASPARRQSLERPGSAQRGVASDGKTVGDDGASDVGDGGGEDGNNSMEGPPPAADDQPPEDGGQDDAQSFAQGLSEQTGVKAEPVEIIDSDDMGGFDPQGGDGGSHDASDAEFTEEKFEGGPAADANDPSMWGAGATNDMFSQPSTSSFTGQDGSNSNDNSGGKGGGSSVGPGVLHWPWWQGTAAAVSMQPRRFQQLSSVFLRNDISSAVSDAFLSPIVSSAPSELNSSAVSARCGFDKLKPLSPSRSVSRGPPNIDDDRFNYGNSSTPEGLSPFLDNLMRKRSARGEIGESSPFPCGSTKGSSTPTKHHFLSSALASVSVLRKDALADTLVAGLPRCTPGLLVGSPPPLLSMTRDCQLSSRGGGVVFTCSWPDCNHTSSRREHFKIHWRKHTGEKPFKCDYCMYRCNQKGQLKNHVLLKHGLSELCSREGNRDQPKVAGDAGNSSQSLP